MNNHYSVDESLERLPQGLGYKDTSNDADTNIFVPEPVSSFPNIIQSYFHKQTSVDESNQNIPSNQNQKSNPDSTIINPVHAIEAAKAIALKFQRQSNSNIQVHSSNLPTQRHISRVMYTKQSLYLHVQKHKQRLQKAMLKNFEYIARKDEESYQLQLKTLEQTKQYDHMLHHYKQRSLEIRKNNKKTSSLTSLIGKKAGVGTNIRKKQSTQERDIIYAHIKQAKTNMTVRKSIYIMGIPTVIHDTNHYKTEGDLQQDLHHLFQSYGPINRIKLYKNHKTKLLKGDALIVYENDDIDLEMVCSQLNKSELPSGNILHVQPADFSAKHSNKKKKNPNDSVVENMLFKNKDNQQVLNTLETQSKKVDENDMNRSKEKPVGEEDLDDFFDSL